MLWPAPADRCRGCSRRRGAAPWDSAARSRRLRARRWRASCRTRSQIALRRVERRQIGRRGAEREFGAVGQHGVDRAHVVHHVAVADRARAAAVVAGHAAERRLRAGRNVDRKPQAVRLQPCVQLVEHHAGLHAHRARVACRTTTIWFRYLLLSMTSAAPTVWPHCEVPPPRGSTGTPSSTRDLQRDLRVALGLRHHHADRLDLVDRRIGRVAPARVRRRTTRRRRFRASGAPRAGCRQCADEKSAARLSPSRGPSNMKNAHASRRVSGNYSRVDAPAQLNYSA